MESSFNPLIISKELQQFSLIEKRAIRDILDGLIVHDEYSFQEKQTEHNPSQCPHCQSYSFVKNGKNKNQVQTYKCKKCARFFSTTTGLSLHGIHYKIKWVEFLKTMLNNEFSSVRKVAKALKINYKTAFKWRNKALYTIHPTVKRFNGITEIDDLHFRFSEKGRKHKFFPEREKKRGDNDFSVKVLCVADRVNTLKLDLVRVGRLKTKDIKRVGLASLLKIESNVLVSDKHPSIKSFGKSINIEHQTFIAKNHSQGKIVHVNTINELASRLKSVVVRKMKGVATKYLQNYLNWFKTVELTKYRSINLLERCFKDRSAYQAFREREANYIHFLSNYTKLSVIT